MNRLSSIALRVAVVALTLCFAVSRIHAQAPATPPPAQTPASPTSSQEHAATDKDGKDKDDKDDDEDDNNPFAPEPAPTLPPGMAGSDANDPRAKLTPGLYDAGETS